MVTQQTYTHTDGKKIRLFSESCDDFLHLSQTGSFFEDQRFLKCLDFWWGGNHVFLIYLLEIEMT